MAYDEALAARIRAVLADQPALVEKKMFGGLGFLVGGNMAVAASGRGGVLVRVDPAVGDALVAGDPAAAPMVMRGREMTGWLSVDEGQLDDEQFETWVRRGLDYAGSLPPKPASP